jgi:hypothetical protein
MRNGANISFIDRFLKRTSLPLSQPTPLTEYVMGHDDRERRRLALQASIINPFTDRLLSRAGISVGMRVLDISCGVGEVSSSLHAW